MDGWIDRCENILNLYSQCIVFSCLCRLLHRHLFLITCLTFSLQSPLPRSLSLSLPQVGVEAAKQTNARRCRLSRGAKMGGCRCRGQWGGSHTKCHVRNPILLIFSTPQMIPKLLNPLLNHDLRGVLNIRLMGLVQQRMINHGIVGFLL